MTDDSRGTSFNMHRKCERTLHRAALMLGYGSLFRHSVSGWSWAWVQRQGWIRAITGAYHGRVGRYSAEILILLKCGCNSHSQNPPVSVRHTGIRKQLL
jgi:hypothetical protein